jgi:two-component system, OmpR family, phosphate regulon sensor histidine kinase PhoR
MQKKILWTITIILSITLVCLIFVQAYWINNAIKINEEQFHQLVIKGMENIVEEIENREIISQVVNEMDPYQDVSLTGAPSINYKLNKLSQSTFSLSTTDEEKEVFIINENDSLNISSQLQLLANNAIQFRNKSGLQINEVSKKQSFGSLKIKSDFGEKLNNRTIFVENVVNKLIQIDVELEDRIDKGSIEEILKRTFSDLGIDIGYEYAVTKNKYKTVYNSQNYSEQNDVRKFISQLYPKDVFAKGNYLYVYFPKERSFVLKSSGFMAFSSILLTLIILLGFSLSIHIMFKQKRLSQIKNDFVNNMTHELKTPISTISLASQMLKDDSIPMESKNIAYISDVIDDESKRLSYQVEKVLKTALFEQGQIKLKLRELNVHKIIENVVKNFEIQVKSKNGKLIKKLEADNPILSIDEVHFTNIIFNLLDNAVKYCKENPEIIVSTRERKNGISVLISDKGIGIKKQDQKRVFDQFFRVSTGNLHDVKGFGLGLSYVKKIVNAHGGEITLVSEYRKGTTFEIFFPNNNINNG